MSIEISHISKRFDNFIALNDINLSIPDGELTALLGPSGSGKTTLLRIIAGLETPDNGLIKFFGEDATNKQSKDRKVGFVFQHYALFKHMNVFENVAFGLKVRPKVTRPPKEEIKTRVRKLLAMVQLDGFARRYPSELSGGQKQRVALARALAVEPKVLLLDEPFGALDAKVRQELRRWLRYLHEEIEITSIFVTHDQEEALELSDNIVILNKGNIEQVGTPEEVYDKPANPFVYSFIGNVNLFHARFEKGNVRLNDPKDHEAKEGDLSLFVRPHDVTISLTNENGKGIEAALTSHRILGGRVRVTARTLIGENEIEVDIEKNRWKEIKDASPKVYLFFNSAKLYSEDSWSDFVI
jgi:sulfate transport system ATP-binding protein